MRLHRLVWLSAVVLFAAVGALGTIGTMAPQRALANVVAAALFGAVMGVAWAIDAKADYGPKARDGALLCATLCVVPGFLHLTGYFGYAVIALLVVTAPVVWRQVMRLVRARGAPLEQEPAALESQAESLRRQWVQSGVQLRNATTARDRLFWVEVRSGILDDLVAQCGGHLPPFLWEPAVHPKKESP